MWDKHNIVVHSRASMCWKLYLRQTRISRFTSMNGSPPSLENFFLGLHVHWILGCRFGVMPLLATLLPRSWKIWLCQHCTMKNTSNELWHGVILSHFAQCFCVRLNKGSLTCEGHYAIGLVMMNSKKWYILLLLEMPRLCLEEYWATTFIRWPLCRLNA